MFRNCTWKKHVSKHITVFLIGLFSSALLFYRLKILYIKWSWILFWDYKIFWKYGLNVLRIWNLQQCLSELNRASRSSLWCQRFYMDLTHWGQVTLCINKLTIIKSTRYTTPPPPPAADSCPRDNFWTTFWISFIFGTIVGPDLQLTWLDFGRFSSWHWPRFFKVKYGICYISAKNAPIALKQKANISIEL